MLIRVVPGIKPLRDLKWAPTVLRLRRQLLRHLNPLRLLPRLNLLCLLRHLNPLRLLPRLNLLCLLQRPSALGLQ